MSEIKQLFKWATWLAIFLMLHLYSPNISETALCSCLIQHYSSFAEVVVAVVSVLDNHDKGMELNPCRDKIVLTDGHCAASVLCFLQLFFFLNCYSAPWYCYFYYYYASCHCCFTVTAMTGSRISVKTAVSGSRITVKQQSHESE